MICPRCQNQLPDNATTCPKCGIQVENIKQPIVVDDKKIKCPNCGKILPNTVKGCFNCGTKFLEQPRAYNAIPAPMSQPQVNQTVPNDNLIQCSACGNMISKLADKCPVCGNPRQKKVANPIILDAITVFAIVIAIFAMIVHKVLFSWATVFIFLIIYALYYEKIKNNPDVDSSKVKQSMTILAVLFLILFLVVLIFNIPLR